MFRPFHAHQRRHCRSFSLSVCFLLWHVQYIPRNMHTVFALLCFVVVIHWLIFPYPSGLLHWHCGNLTSAPVPAKQPWWVWINTSCEFIMNDCITTTKQSTTKPCDYFLGYTVKSMMTSRHGNAFHITSLVCRIHRPPLDSPHNGPVMRTLDVSLLLAWVRCLVSVDLGRYDSYVAWL